MLIKETKRTSEWIQSVGYSGAGEGKGFLIIIKTDGEAMVYEDVPFFMPGLLQAGIRGSMGKAYHKHVKGKYKYTKLNEEEAKIVVGMFEEAKKVV